MLTLDSLKTNADVIAGLSELCDFELQDRRPERPFCSVEGASDLTVFAQDGAGGQFALSPSGQVFYFSSEGGGGLLAEDLTALLRLLVYRPYWMIFSSFLGRVTSTRCVARTLRWRRTGGSTRHSSPHVTLWKRSLTSTCREMA